MYLYGNKTFIQPQGFGIQKPFEVNRPKFQLTSKLKSTEVNPLVEKNPVIVSNGEILFNENKLIINEYYGFEYQDKKYVLHKSDKKTIELYEVIE